MSDIATTYMGLALKSPLIVASSTLTDTVDKIRQCEDAGAGAVVIKSLFEEEISAHVSTQLQESQQSFWHVEGAEYMAQYGAQNAIARHLELIQKAKQAVEIPVLASVNCVSADVWPSYAEQIEQAGADGIELNVYIIPADTRLDGPATEKRYFDIVDAVADNTKAPIALKIGPHFTALGDVIKRLSETQLKGLVLFNRFYRPHFDIENFELVPAPPFSCPTEMGQSLRWVALMSDKVSCDLAAATGIHNSQGLIMQLLAGARAAQVCSAVLQNGYGHITHMLNELQAWMHRHQFTSLADFWGKMAQSQSDNPSEYERVQFMKFSTKA